MANKPRHTLADYVAIAISPALIMTLVSSLVFFILAVVYTGDFIDRLRWILFWYVFGSVLVARISMETYISQRAPLYGILLAVVVFIAVLLYVDYPPELRVVGWLLNLVLIALIWWSTYKLTWDCTYIDDKVEQSGEGLLQAAGLENETAASEASAEEKKLGWWERYQRYRAERKKKHAPGVWVVYFSLAALPIFGLGQALIPTDTPDAVERRRHVFWLMGTYIGSGLGLLLTTAFLGLRRYLRQRNLQMPLAMTGVWLGIGAVLIAVLLVAGALLPRPNSETPLFSLAKLTGEREGSDYDVLGGKGGKGDGKAADEPSRDEKKGNERADGQQDKNADQTRSGDGKNGSDSKGDSNSGDKKGDQKGDPKGDSPSKEQSGDRKGDSDSKNGEKKKDPNADKSKSGEKSKEGSSGSSSGDSSKSQKGRQSQTSKTSSGLKMPEWVSRVGTVLKWIVFGVLALVVVIVLLRQGLSFLANFTNWARNLLNALRALWARLFGGGAAQPKEETPVVDAPGMRLRPFAAFRNPFRDGSAEKRSPQELVQYSFAALQAWAFERDLGRSPEETPLEFAYRLGQELPALEENARKLAILYARVVYARGSLPAASAAAVQQFWNQLEAMVEQPMSA
jgi:hypothetical protein